MSISIKFLEEDKIAVILLSGILTDETLGADYHKVLAAVAGEREKFNTLWDLSDADFNEVTREMTLNFSKLVTELSNSTQKAHNLKTKSALYTTDKLGFGLSRMYEIIHNMSDSTYEVSVFSEYDEAIKWLSGV